MKFFQFALITGLSSAILNHTAFAQTKPQDSSADTEATTLDALVVTASGVDESIRDVPQTIRAYDPQEINAFQPRQLADFFQQNGIGNTQNWSVGHSVVNLRGASTSGQGQGWSNGSEVTVLINGRSAGTANLGKISLNDIQSIEVLRGPNSVLYGSSALGGVINLTTKTGADFQGTQITGTYGSFDTFTGILQTGGNQGPVDWYFEVSGKTSDSYETGDGSAGTQPNTDYKQTSVNFSLGWQINDKLRAEFLFRHDGIYDAGHPGATYSLSDYDDRYNTSAEIKLSGSFADERVKWSNQAFYTRDVDEFHWSQNPQLGVAFARVAQAYLDAFNAALAPYGVPLGTFKYVGSPGITSDVNKRTQQEFGDNLAAQIKIVDSNTLIAGANFKYTKLDGDRERSAADGYITNFTQTYPALNYLPAAYKPTIAYLNSILVPVDLPPLQIDSKTYTLGAYLQDTQKFFDDKLALRAGGRYDYVNQEAEETQNYTLPDNTSRNKSIFVYQAGLTYSPLDWLTLRGNLGTGFLSPNPEQLYGKATQANGFIFSPNPDLDDEKSFGWDLGFRVAAGGFTADISYYENKIEDYITYALAPDGVTFKWDNADEKKVRGLEWQAAYDIAVPAHWEGYSLQPYTSGNYYFENKSQDLTGAVAETSDINEYNFVLGVRGGKPGKWSVDFNAVFAGHAIVTPGFGQNVDVPIADFAARAEIPSYVIFNFAASYQFTKYVGVFGGINNIANKDYSTYYYALNDKDTKVSPQLYPGTYSAYGDSSPGREYYFGVNVTF